jgi:hypothetical protein
MTTNPNSRAVRASAINANRAANFAANVIARWNDDDQRNRWVPACGGTEEVFTARGIRWLYCYNAYLGLHRYLNVDTDRIVEDDEYAAIVGL